MVIPWTLTRNVTLTEVSGPPVCSFIGLGELAAFAHTGTGTLRFQVRSATCPFAPCTIRNRIRHKTSFAMNSEAVGPVSNQLAPATLPVRHPCARGDRRGLDEVPQVARVKWWCDRCRA